MKCQSSSRILSPSSPSLWKTAHVHQQLLHSSPRFINNSSLFSEGCGNLRGIHAETHQAQAWMGVEFKWAGNNNSWSSSSVRARKRISSCPNPANRVAQNWSPLLHLLPVSSFTDVIFLLHKVQKCCKATLHQLTSSLAHCLCLLNQTLTSSKDT